MKNNEGKQKICPYCAEMIPNESTECKYCESFLDTKDTKQAESNTQKDFEGQVVENKFTKKKSNKKILVFAAIGILIIGTITIISFFMQEDSAMPDKDSDIKDEEAITEELDEIDEERPIEQIEEGEGEAIEDNIYYVSVNGDSSLFLRKTPGSDNKPEEDLIEQISNNTEIIVNNKHDNSIEEDGYIWWEIYNPSSEKTGWAASEFVSKEMSPELDSYDVMDYLWMPKNSLIQKIGEPDEEGGIGGSMYVFYDDLDMCFLYDYSSDNKVFGFMLFSNCEFKYGETKLIGKTFHEVEDVFGEADYRGVCEKKGMPVLIYDSELENFTMYADTNTEPINEVIITMKY